MYSKEISYKLLAVRLEGGKEEEGRDGREAGRQAGKFGDFLIYFHILKKKKKIAKLKKKILRRQGFHRKKIFYFFKNKFSLKQTWNVIFIIFIFWELIAMWN